MANINAGDLKKGLYIMFKDAPHRVQSTEFMNPGKGSAIMRVRLKNLLTEAVSDFTYRTSEFVPEADVSKVEMEFLYRDGDQVFFMNPQTFEQATISAETLGVQVGFLTQGLKCWTLWFDERPIGVILPPHVNLRVVEAFDAVAGNRVNAPKKPVTVETGIEIQAPLFVKTGDVIVVDTETGEYLSRLA